MEDGEEVSAEEDVDQESDSYSDSGDDSLQNYANNTEFRDRDSAPDPRNTQTDSEAKHLASKIDAGKRTIEATETKG